MTVAFGDVLTLIGGLFYAIHMVVVAKFSRDKDPILLTIIQFATSAVLSWVCGGIFEEFPKAIGSETIFGILYMGVFATAIALLLQNVGQKYIHPSSVAVILSLESVFGVIFSVFMGKESLTIKITLGFLLIFIAVIISETKLSFLKKKKIEKIN